MCGKFKEVFVEVLNTIKNLLLISEELELNIKTRQMFSQWQNDL